MPIVVLEVRDEGSNNVTGVRATMDGAPVSDRTPTFVNPGEHRMAVEAPGFRPMETAFVAREPSKRLRVLVFMATGPAPAPTPVPLVGGPEATSPERTSFASGRQKLALALGLAGVAGLAVGTTWSFMSKSTYDHAVSSECGGDPHNCSTQGTADGQTAHHQADIATAGFIAGGVLLAAGAALYFTSPKRTGVAVSPALDRTSGGLAVAGTW